MKKVQVSKDFLQDVIELSINTDLIVEDCEKLLAAYKHNASPETDFTKPYSILLTEAPDPEKDEAGIIHYDELNKGGFFDRDTQAVLKKEYQNTNLSSLVKSLPFAFSIMRLSVLPPTTIITMHQDAAPHAQLAIRTNPDCFVACRNGEMCHVAVDGRLYVFSTTLPHTALNASQKERVHLSISIYDPKA